MISPSECTVVTEMMPTWRALWNQRLRWQRGALENLGAYGLTPKTFRYWAQQLGIGYGVVALASYFLLLAVTALAVDSWIWFPFWMGMGALFSVERVVTVWDGGWRARLVGALLIPELVYATFLDVVYVKGVLDILLGRQAGWKHVTRAPAEQAHDRLRHTGGDRTMMLAQTLADGALRTGMLLPESVIHTDAFKVLATFVALNTLMYATLAVVKTLPRVHRPAWLADRNRRAQDRSIYAGRTDRSPDRGSVRLPARAQLLDDRPLLLGRQTALLRATGRTGRATLPGRRGDPGGDQGRQPALRRRAVAELLAVLGRRHGQHPAHEPGPEALDEPLALHRGEHRGGCDVPGQLDPRVRRVHALAARAGGPAEPDRQLGSRDDERRPHRDAAVHAPIVPRRPPGARAAAASIAG